MTLKTRRTTQGIEGTRFSKRFKEVFSLFEIKKLRIVVVVITLMQGKYSRERVIGNICLNAIFDGGLLMPSLGK